VYLIPQLNFQQAYVCIVGAWLHLKALYKIKKKLKRLKPKYFSLKNWVLPALLYSG